MSCVSKKMLSMRSSPTIEISNLARKLKAQGNNIIPFGIGETDFREPEEVDKDAISAINKGNTKYPPVAGYPNLKAAIIDKLKRDNSLSYTEDQIIVCNGVKQALYNLICATINPGEEVIIPAPYWVSYIDIVKIAGGIPVIVDCKPENNFKLDPSDLKKAITERTKWVIFNSPNNPTGTCYSYDDIKAITNVILEFSHVYIMADDIYEHIIYDNVPFHTLAEVEPKLFKRIVTINGVSKAYSMTGWRVGYAAGDKQIIDAMSILQSQSTSGVCSIAQYAAIAALNGNQEILRFRTKILKNRRNLAMDILSKIPDMLTFNIPQGAFYLFISCQKLIKKKTKKGEIIKNSQDFARYLLNEYQVVIIPGSAFGKENFFRLSYATNESLIKLGCERIVEACKDLQD